MGDRTEGDVPVGESANEDTSSGGQEQHEQPDPCAEFYQCGGSIEGGSESEPYHRAADHFQWRGGWHDWNPGQDREADLQWREGWHDWNPGQDWQEWEDVAWQEGKHDWNADYKPGTRKNSWDDFDFRQVVRPPDPKAGPGLTRIPAPLPMLK